jgi:hypothetical protein
MGWAVEQRAELKNTGAILKLQYAQSLLELLVVNIL